MGGEASLDAVALGTAALTRGDWAEARARFEEALSLREAAASLEGLAEALFWLDEVERSLECRARAHSLYREEGAPCRAARAALWLAIGHMSAYGNAAAANGWLQRADRLLDEVGPCAERGWLEHLRGKMTSDAVAAARHARAAVETAQRHGDPDLEVWALSEEGRALVSLGRVEQGMALLDEAVAAAVAGDARDPFVVGNTCCNMLSACDRALDLRRAVQWCQVVDDFSRRHRYLPIFHYCRVVYAGVLVATGRWDEAEDELKRALHGVERKYPLERVHSLTRLALLCVRRDRLEEARELLTGVESHGLATEAVAALHLAAGEAALAAALVERRLATLGDGLAAVPLLGLLVEARLAASDVEGAAAAAARLLAIAEKAQRPPFEALAQLAVGRVARLAGGAPRPPLEKACSAFEGLEMPFEAAVARLECARALADGDRALALDDARLALSRFEGLGARRHADEAAALLRQLGGRRPPARTPGEMTTREREVLGLLSHGLSNAAIAERLFISRKTVEHHVGRILSKLGLRSRAEAVAWALRQPPSASGEE